MRGNREASSWGTSGRRAYERRGGQNGRPRAVFVLLVKRDGATGQGAASPAPGPGFRAWVPLHLPARRSYTSGPLQHTHRTQGNQVSLPRALSCSPAGWRPAGGLQGWLVVEVELVEEEPHSWMLLCSGFDSHDSIIVADEHPASTNGWDGLLSSVVICTVVIGSVVPPRAGPRSPGDRALRDLPLSLGVRLWSAGPSEGPAEMVISSPCGRDR
ncbi:unnamed protein product [Boreogadus saida]